MAICFLGIGSNLGDKEKNISKALKKISNLDNTELLNKANIYKTLPVSPIDQPKYLNTAVRIKTELFPGCLLKEVKNIENDLGRKKRERWGPRIIDIDILLYGSKIIKSENLTVPHLLLHKRNFVLKPLKDIAPEFKHPILNKTISEIYEDYKKN